jgi:hypothetical protein
VRVKHTYLNRSIPESTVAFTTKYVDGAVGRSGKKIKVNGLQSKWALIFNKHRSKTRIERLCTDSKRQPSTNPTNLG